VAANTPLALTAHLAHSCQAKPPRQKDGLLALIYSTSGMPDLATFLEFFGIFGHLLAFFCIVVEEGVGC